MDRPQCRRLVASSGRVRALGLACGLLAAAASLALPASGRLPEGAGPQFSTLAPVLQKVTPAVVNIVVRTRIRETNPLYRDPFFRRSFETADRIEQDAMPAGSAVVIDAERGLLLTNNHLVEYADSIEVVTLERRRFNAILVGRDPVNDIAVLRVQGAALTALPLADSDRLQLGDFVMAVGNPFGVGNTVTSGIVSALGRGVPGGSGHADFVQTDAAITPGNSGGALVDMQGRLVGINTALLSAGGAGVVGFAVPINVARRTMERILSAGSTRTGRIGVMVSELTSATAKALQLGRSQGAIVVGIVDNSPAARADIRVNDVIVAVDGTQIGNQAELVGRVALVPVGKATRLTIERNGQPLVIEVIVSAIDVPPPKP